ncbi:HPP family-domain-containing protein [Amanita rubescens]|nr:HPP family-domain-containing protein [Amanita rubescens]
MDVTYATSDEPRVKLPTVSRDWLSTSSKRAPGPRGSPQDCPKKDQDREGALLAFLWITNGPDAGQTQILATIEYLFEDRVAGLNVRLNPIALTIAYVCVIPAFAALCDLSRWPFWLSRWLGYRAMRPPALPWYRSIFWCFIATFCGVALIQGIFGRVKTFVGHEVPPIVYSYGSAAAIAFATFDSPTAQPRAFLTGHFMGALVGVSITKLFDLVHGEETSERYLWLTGALSCSVAILLMTITNTVHPPAGATSVLASTTPEVRQMGWVLLPIVIISVAFADHQNQTGDADEKHSIGQSELGTTSRAWFSDTTLASLTIPEKAHLPV